jgi:hypothetical protein
LKAAIDHIALQARSSADVSLDFSQKRSTLDIKRGKVAVA